VSSGLSNPSACIVGSDGLLYVASYMGSCIIRYNLDGTNPETICSRPVWSFCLDEECNVYISPWNDFSIYKWSSSSRTESVYVQGSTHGMAQPWNMCMDHEGNLFIAEAYKIRKVTPTGEVTIVAGSSNGGGSVDGNGASAQFQFIHGMVADADNNIIIADFAKIRKLDAEGNVTSIAGSGSQMTQDGVGSSASFNSAFSVAFDSAGNLFVAQTTDSKIRALIEEDGQYRVTTLPTSCSITQYTWLTFDAEDNMYTIDYSGNRVYKLTAQ